jgi:hypothetical protein
MKDVENFNSSTSPQSVSRRSEALSLGTCQNGFIFFAPDKKGDANSTEAQYFYDSSCTQLARDAVRIYASTGSSSETVSRTVTTYASGSQVPSATRTDAVTITNATFDQYGFPIAANGFDRVSIDELGIAGSKTVDSDDEIVMQPASGGVNQFCADSAGFNATGIAQLGETFGWQGAVLTPGTRTLNGDGSVTWSATHSGSTEKGAIGALSIATGAQNTTCPISAPMFTIAGGTQGGTYSIPVSATYKNGLLVGLSVQNAQLANGDTLNVTTNANVAPENSQFVSGSISNGGSVVATFDVDAFGDGTLTAASGKQFVITDWHVVK